MIHVSGHVRAACIDEADEREEYVGAFLTHRDKYMQQTGTQAEIGEIRLNQDTGTGKMKGCDVAGITTSDTRGS